MSYSQKLAYYRNQFKKHLDARDTSNAKLYAMLYAKLLREIIGQINSYADRAKLTAEAEKYDLFAAMITRYGITAAVKKAISNGETSVPPTVGKKDPKDTESPSHSKELTTDGETTAEDADWGADVFERSSPATLIVMTESGVGTGFFITSDGYFLTNHHVIHNGSKRDTYITVESGDGKIKCEAEFVKADKTRDVALLKLKNHRGKTPFIPLIKDYSQVRPGIAMMIIGNGLNFGLAPSAGNVKFAHSKSDGNLVYTAPSNNGDSGAPVFNKDGECIGIHKSVTVGQVIGNTQIRVTGLSNATPAEDIRKLLSKWGLEGKI
jgi:S1-C subfamily serine protease